MCVVKVDLHTSGRTERAVRTLSEKTIDAQKPKNRYQRVGKMRVIKSFTPFPLTCCVTMLLHVLILSWSCPSFSIRNVHFCFEVDFEFVHICGCTLKKERKKVVMPSQPHTKFKQAKVDVIENDLELCR